MVLLFLALVSAIPGSGYLSLSHFFYRNFYRLDSDIKWEGSGYFRPSFSFKLSTKSDRILSRGSKKIGMFVTLARNLGNDTLFLDLSGEHSKETRGTSSNSSTGGRVGLSLFRVLYAFMTRLGGAYEKTSYSGSSGELDNSGFILKFSLEGGPLSELKLRLEKRKVNSMAVGAVRAALPMGHIGSAALTASYEREYYSLEGAQDARNRARAGLKFLRDVAVMPLSLHFFLDSRAGFFRRKMEFMADRTEIGGSGGCSVKANLGKVFLKLEFENGIGLSDFINFEGDERLSRRRAYFEARFPLLQFSIQTKGEISLSRYSYPQGIRTDDRDLRNSEGLLKLSSPPKRWGRFSASFSYSGKDLLYVRSERSYNTRRNEEYRLGFTYDKKPPLELRAKVDIVALYSLYRFDQNRNLLIRYALAEFDLFYPDSGGFLSLVLRGRLQDQGGYVEEGEKWYFLRKSRARENWVYPSVRIIRVKSFRLYADAGFYERLSAPVEKTLVLTAFEKFFGLRLEGPGVEAYYRRHRRGYGSFSSFSLLIERRF